MRWDFTWQSSLSSEIMLRGTYCIRWTIAAQLNIPEWSPNHSAVDVDQTLGSADDYLSSDDRVGSEGRWDFGQLGVDGQTWQEFVIPVLSFKILLVVMVFRYLATQMHLPHRLGGKFMLDCIA